MFSQYILIVLSSLIEGMERERCYVRCYVFMVISLTYIIRLNSCIFLNQACNQNVLMICACRIDIV